jgi:glycosyltransferase involved in cell wall biosynthesis
MKFPTCVIYIIDGLGMGGAERLMVPILKRLDAGRFAARVCVLQSKGDNPLAADIRALGVPVDDLPIARLRDFGAVGRLRNYLRGHRAGIVHTQLEFSNILGGLAAKTLRLPSLSTVHVLPTDDVRARTRLHQRVEWFALRFFCDRVLAVSEETRRRYIAESGIPARKLTTLYNGIDLSAGRRRESGPARDSVRNEFNLPRAASLLTTVAVLRPPKGIEFMLRAMPAILESRPDAYYLVVGDGTHREALENETRRLGLRERVVFAGLRKDVPRLLAASDIFVLPTLTEALPTVLAEAMAARLPVVASAVGGVPEMIADGENGILVPPAQPEALSRACAALLSDAETRRGMGERGWQIVQQKFNIETQVRQLENIYVEEMSRHGK